MGFGDFSQICEQAPVPLCSVVGAISHIAGSHGIEADCYARNIELANTIIFQGAASFMHIVALIMTVIMILHVRSKFTAVGRKEITFFFYIYMMLTFISLVLDSGVVPPGSSAYPYFAAAQGGLVSSLCVCLMINGFVGFQLYEDGTAISVWLLRGVSLGAFIITGFISLATFKSWAGLGPTKTMVMFVFLYLVSGLELLVYFIMQILLVVQTLQERWPLGDLAFGAFFFIIGQVILYVFSNTICNAVQHYLDGLFFATICNLLAVMMVYKYWDSITREDLEFSVGTKLNNWEVKELLPEDERRNTIYQDTEYSSNMYNHPQQARNSNYGGFAY
ncbi:chitin synthase export chaperone [Mollisia scopiformis]|uniref:Chitin synthase export chaperone n=1 Tax=Mollisia scopiformis TaxID=149040 RepID=A0A194XQN5_MOLSC|nr:chitin synthase export chaperone [Mollisia scopiformis]KUJ22032.1 chitin synthase export chaperone [Mollisia scopiformis]